MTKTAALSIRIPGELKKALETAAEKDRRSVASYVQMALEDYLKQQGFLSSSGEPPKADE